MEKNSKSKEDMDLRKQMKNALDGKMDPKSAAMIKMLNVEIKKMLSEMAAHGLDAALLIAKAIPLMGPVYGAALDVKAMMVAFSYAAAEQSKFKKDEALAITAFEEGDRDAFAFIGVAERDRQRRNRKLHEGCAKMISAAGGFAQGSPEPASQTAGKLLKGIGDIYGVGQSYVFKFSDAYAANVIKDLRKKAKAGDIKAQNELFRKSEREQKGLIALGLEEENRIAIDFINSRSGNGLSANEMKALGKELLRDWLLAVDGQDLYDQEREFMLTVRSRETKAKKLNDKWNARTLRWRINAMIKNFDNFHAAEIRKLSSRWQESPSNRKILSDGGNPGADASFNIERLRIDTGITRDLVKVLCEDVDELILDKQKKDALTVGPDEGMTSLAEYNELTHEISDLQKRIILEFNGMLHINGLAKTQLSALHSTSHNISEQSKRQLEELRQIDMETISKKAEKQRLADEIPGLEAELLVIEQQLTVNLQTEIESYENQLAMEEEERANYYIENNLQPRTLEELDALLNNARSRATDTQLKLNVKTMEKQTKAKRVEDLTMELASLESRRNETPEASRAIALQLSDIHQGIEEYQSMVNAFRNGTLAFQKVQVL